jgi:hypothetical protein
MDGLDSSIVIVILIVSLSDSVSLADYVSAASRLCARSFSSQSESQYQQLISPHVRCSHIIMRYISVILLVFILFQYDNLDYLLPLGLVLQLH